MKQLIRLFFTLFLLLTIQYSHAGITDSLFNIKDADVRLNIIDNSYHRYDIKSNEATLFMQEVLAKGNDAEKMIISWMQEDRQLGTSNRDSSIAIFDRYLPDAIELGNPHLLAILYSVKANALLNIKKYSRAFENYLYAYEQLKKDPKKQYFGQTWILHNIAMNFYLFKDYPKAIEMANEVTRLPPPLYYSLGWFLCNNYDLIGVAYLKMNQYDSAHFWLNKTYEIADQYNDTAWLGIARGNIGSVFYEQARYDEAIPHFEKGIAYCSQTGIWDNVAPFSIELAHIYILKGQLDKAGNLLAQAKAANDKYSKVNNLLNYYNVASLYERVGGNYSKAFELADSARRYEKIIGAEFTSSKRALAESQLNYEKQLMENKMLQQKAKDEQSHFYGLAAISLLILFALALLIKRQKLKYSLQQKILQNEKLQAEKELSVALFEIKEFTHNITQKNKAIDNLIIQVQHLKANDKKITPQEVEAIEEDMKQSAMLTEEGWADFNKMFEKAFPGTILKFREKLPELDDTGRRYFKLLKLELNNKEIAAMLGTDDAGIATLRKTLVGKLGLTDEHEIEILVESL